VCEREREREREREIMMELDKTAESARRRGTDVGYVLEKTDTERELYLLQRTR
jgi:hypothetical protein